MILDRLYNLQERLRRRRRVRTVPLRRLKDYSNPLEQYDAVQFKRRFHLEKETVLYVMSLVEVGLHSAIRRGVWLPTIIQLTTVLRYYASGSFQLVIEDLGDVSQATISRLIVRISKRIAKLARNFIVFPSHSNSTEHKRKFAAIAGFPGVVGTIDCSHVRILSPGGEDAELFRNRKNYFSINVQAVSDAEINFTNIVCRWYGSAHDSRILENSLLYEDLDSGTSPGILLGDAGYTLFPWLLTPFSNPVGRGQKRYNKAHCSTRNTVERMFGVWKRKFPCLFQLRVKMSTALMVIVATAVLHNITRQRRDIYMNDRFEPDDPENFDTSDGIHSSLRGKTVRNTLVSTHFS